MYARGLTTLVIAIGVAHFSVAAYGQASPTPASTLDELDNALLNLTRESEPSPKAESNVDDLRKEIADIRRLLQILQDTLDGKLAAITELEDENRRLRHALRVRYGREEAGLPPVPMPNRDLIESVLADSVSSTDAQIKAPSTPEAEPYTVVSEWGRSPAVAADLPGNVSSLIGMAIAVRAGTEESAIRALGHELRKTYDEYDNINIEIYDDVEAARNYADHGSSSTGHRVLSISKHKHSERDTIVLFRNGVSVVIR